MPEKTAENKIDFSQIRWQTKAFGIREKSIELGNKNFRLLELSKDLDHPEWCQSGHIGYIVSGQLKIDFLGHHVFYSAGDALIIAEGESEKHIPQPLSDKVLLFLVEDI